ncbi:MAG TPA: potassium channel family protein [Nitrososphaerales archaeon]|nr:potassium channel family protein [Nitrososphaerales archaeon]
MSGEVDAGVAGPHRRRIPKSFLERAVYSFLLIAAVVLLGTMVMHSIEGWSYVDSFYFTSMIATGQGPPANLDPQSAFGKVFTSLLAFISVGTVVSALLFLFGPFFGRVFRLSVERIEEAEKEHES